MTASEMIDVLNDEGEVIDTISRDLAEQGNHITQNVLVFIFNSSDKVWVQLRPLNKKHYPGKWDISTCGGVMSGEMHETAAYREVFEEMGIRVELHHVESFLNVFTGDNNELRKRLSHLYVGASDKEPKVNADVDAFMSWQPKKLRANVMKNPDVYVPSFLAELDKALKGFDDLKQSSRILRSARLG